MFWLVAGYNTRQFLNVRYVSCIISCRVQAGRLEDAEILALKSLEMVRSQSEVVEDLSSRYMYLYGHLAHIETQVGTVLFSLPAVIKLINEVVL